MPKPPFRPFWPFTYGVAGLLTRVPALRQGQAAGARLPSQARGPGPFCAKMDLLVARTILRTQWGAGRSSSGPCADRVGSSQRPTASPGCPDGASLSSLQGPGGRWPPISLSLLVSSAGLRLVFLGQVQLALQAQKGLDGITAPYAKKQPLRHGLRVFRGLTNLGKHQSLVEVPAKPAESHFCHR